MKLEQKKKIVDKYGSKLINEVFIKLVKGKTVQWLSEKYNLPTKVIEDFLRVTFYTLDAIIVDQKEEVEGWEVLTRSALAMLPEKQRKALIEKTKQKK